jgi:hypothetical protein
VENEVPDNLVAEPTKSAAHKRLNPQASFDSLNVELAWKLLTIPKGVTALRSGALCRFCEGHRSYSAREKSTRFAVGNQPATGDCDGFDLVPFHEFVKTRSRDT